MTKPTTYNINLISKDPFFETSSGKVLVWLVNIGRYIIVFTASIVILSFSARFYLDRRLVDLNSEIHSIAAVIESQRELENNFRLAQNKIQSFKQIEQQDNLAEIFPLLQQVVPNNVILQQLNIDRNLLRIESLALSNSALNYFISNLQLSPYFDNISVHRIESRDERRIGFRVMVSTEYIIPKESN